VCSKCNNKKRGKGDSGECEGKGKGKEKKEKASASGGFVSAFETCAAVGAFVMAVDAFGTGAF
jgi:hypothetical protein